MTSKAPSTRTRSGRKSTSTLDSIMRAAGQKRSPPPSPKKPAAQKNLPANDGLKSSPGKVIPASEAAFSPSPSSTPNPKPKGKKACARASSGKGGGGTPNSIKELKARSTTPPSEEAILDPLATPTRGAPDSSSDPSKTLFSDEEADVIVTDTKKASK